ncbi:hypothetical protein LOD99_14988 [Oopsacas minuta]|uniref:Ubiquitin-conjugating enzyme E2 J2 n=1 Tax=Oopsacas minuta TaxID=111878 RepID=A0AAV7KCT5_9METZ|nr:hypothetical protein LOD99_14988 [Oopsacas minuta]
MYSHPQTSIHASSALTALSRLKQDYLRIKKDPVPFISAEPLPSQILEWHFVVEGPQNSPYYGGFYHGKLLFPKEYPFKPPAIYMQTPNGRFRTNERICLSISDFHPELWNPSWSVSTILTGLLSFMLENSQTVGSIESSPYDKQKLAHDSLQYNLRNSLFKELFPEIVLRIQEKLQSESQAITTYSDSFESLPITKSIGKFVCKNLCLIVGGVVIYYTARYLYS